MTDTSPNPDQARRRNPLEATASSRYWRANLRVMLPLLLVWFLVGPGLSILWVEPLNRFQLGGFPLGFWFAQQGSILVFVGLIGTYALIMNRLDRRYHRETLDRGGGSS